MARTTITAVNLGDVGYNLTDSAGFTTMGVGATNGIEVAYDGNARIILKNTTGGSAVYTVKIPVPAHYTALGLTGVDKTITVATLKTWILRPHASMRQADGDIYIDCDVAGSILVVL